MQRRDVQRACHHTYHTTVPMSHDGTSTSASTVLPLHLAHDALVVVEHQCSLHVVSECCLHTTTCIPRVRSLCLCHLTAALHFDR